MEDTQCARHRPIVWSSPETLKKMFEMKHQNDSTTSIYLLYSLMIAKSSYTHIGTEVCTSHSKNPSGIHSLKVLEELKMVLFNAAIFHGAGYVHIICRPLKLCALSNSAETLCHSVLNTASADAGYLSSLCEVSKDRYHELLGIALPMFWWQSLYAPYFQSFWP